jgi:hypothetical protein
MRELAAAAAWRGFSLSEVARRINERGYRLAASNVRRYLTAKSRPHQETIDLLAEAIGLQNRHVVLASGERLGSRESRAAERSLRLRLATVEAEFEAGAVDQALRLFSQLDPDKRTAILGAYELQQLRADSWMLPTGPANGPIIDEHHPVSAFSAALKHQTGFDLLSRLRHHSITEEALWDIWLRLVPPLGPFTPNEADSIIATAVGLLRKRRVDTAPMEEQLRRKRAALQRADALARQKENT